MPPTTEYASAAKARHAEPPRTYRADLPPAPRSREDQARIRAEVLRTLVRSRLGADALAHRDRVLAALAADQGAAERDTALLEEWRDVRERAAADG